MKSILVLFIVIIGLANAQSPQTFSASIQISNDPNVRGIVTATLYYDYTTAKMRTDFTSLGVIEVWNYTAHIRYLGCGSTCDAETNRAPMPVYFTSGADSAAGQIVGIDGRICNGYNKADTTSGVQTVYIDSSNLVCRALFINQVTPGQPGKQIDFTAVAAIPSSTDMNIYLQWACPPQQCVKLIDIELVFDESGSITAPSFQTEISFAESLANSYTLGPLAIQMGLVMFSTTSHLIFSLNNDKQSVLNGISGVVQDAGSTCIGCGVATAQYDLFTSVNYRANSAKVIIVLTDGYNNVNVATFNTTLDAARQAGIIILAIGVGPDVDVQQLNEIGTVIPGVQTVFTTADWNSLANILNNIVISTCLDLPGNPCGAGCIGFCSCGSTCVCPPICNDSNPCTQDYCTLGQNGNGCNYPPTVCDDNNACTADSCDPASGCVFTTISCDDSDPCTIDSCNPSVGCQHAPKNCNDGNPCTADSCVSTNLPNGCYYTNVTCDLCKYPVVVQCPPINCMINECNPSTGTCNATAINCDDGNQCSNDGCDTTTGNCTHTPISCDDGNQCTHDYCDPMLGCEHTYFNVSYECNDNNVCTIDSCANSTGCVHTNISCSDGLDCTTDTCNSLIGCQHTTRDCAKEVSVSVCYLAQCAEGTGCYLQTISTLTQDCGICAASLQYCPAVSTTTAAGIGAGVLAAIIIGSIVVVAGLAAFGGKKGYDIWLRHKNNMAGAQANPLYHDNGLSGTNPLHAH